MSARPHQPLLVLAGYPRFQNGAGVDVALSTRDAALLALLALEGPQQRARLVALFWPESTEEQGRNALRQRLFGLRRACGHAVVLGSALLSLSQDVQHDLHSAVSLLADLRLPQCPQVDQWLENERQRRTALRREALIREMDALESTGETRSAVILAQELLQLDRLSEEAHRRLIRLHFLQGDKAAALLAFDRCAEMLKHEVGASPSDQTLQLLESIQRVTSTPNLVLRRQVPPSVIRPPRMIGREALRQSVRRDLDSGCVSVILGEAGMGKTRLLSELGLNAQRWVCTSARPGDSGVPFSTLARMLRELMRHAPSVLELAPRHEIARFMPELGPASQSTHERQRMVLEQAVHAFVEAAQPEVEGFVLDDVHFADEASLDMLQAVIGSTQGLTLQWVLAMRPAQAQSRAAGLMEALLETGRLASAAVSPLSVAELVELVDSLGVSGLQGFAIGPMLHQHSGGNPLFALETVKRLVLEDVLTDTGVHIALPRPASVMALIESRLGKLSEDALAVARVAAVGGNDFSIEVAEFVLEKPALKFADAWSELEQAQVLRAGAFAHDLVYEAVLRSIPAPIRDRTHARLATYLGEHNGVAARIAQHWISAKRPGEALVWLKQAAREAGQALRTKEQVDFLLQAASIEEQSGALQEAFKSLYAAMQVEGKSGPSLDCDLGAKLQTLAQTAHQQALASTIQLRQFAQLLRFADAVEIGERALTQALQSGDDSLHNEIKTHLGYALSYCDRRDEAVELLRSARPWIESLANPELRLNYFGNFAILLDDIGRLSEAQALNQQALDTARELEMWSTVAVAYANLGNYEIAQGQIDSALEHLLEAERLIALYEVHEQAPPGPANTLVVCLRIKGRYQDALQWADTTLTRATEAQSATFAAFAHIRKAEVWIDLGRFALAKNSLDAVALNGETPSIVREAVLYVQVRMLRAQGAPYAHLLANIETTVGPKARPDVLHRFLLERALVEPPLQAMALTEQVIEEARAMGHQGTVMAAWARRAGCLCKHDPALALSAAQRALDLLNDCETRAIYRPEIWLNAALAMQAGGQEPSAQHLLLLARDWIMTCVRSGQVPKECVDSFLHRNAVNREILQRVNRVLQST